MLWGLMGCDDGASRPAGDLTVEDAQAIDAVFDMQMGAADAGRDAGRPDQSTDQTLDQTVDMAMPDAMVERCVDRPSPRPDGAWRVQGCDFVTTGDGVRIPRAVVVSADSLARNARTPLHTQLEYRQLADLGLDWVWLLLTWDGIMPIADTVNGAYLGRICEQIDFAHTAGMQVVLSMYQRRWGPALNGHGAPPWATPPNLEPVPLDAVDHPSLHMAWDGFWDARPMRAQFIAAWERLVDTCADSAGIIGIQPLAHPIRNADEAAALTQQIRTAAEAKWGPLLVFVDGEQTRIEAPDVVYAPTIWPGDEPGPAVRAIGSFDGPRFVRGAVMAQLSLVEDQGAGWAIWHDGFGTDPFALRDAEGRIGATGLSLRDRVWPTVVGGTVQGFGETNGVFSLRWLADGRNAGLTVIHVPGPAEPQVELLPAGVDGFTAYDPLAEELSVFVQGAVGPVEVQVRR